MEIIFIFWVLFSIGVGFLANERGRSGIGWTLLSIITSPFLGILLVLLTRDLKVEAQSQQREEMRHKEQLIALSGTKQTISEQYRNTGVKWVRPNADNSATERHAPILVADELEKLANLKERGLLTSEEFSTQKARLLSANEMATEVSRRHGSEFVAPTEEDFASPSTCFAVLDRLGCKVSNTGENKWEILQPTGMTFYAHSKKDLVNFTRRYLSSRNGIPAA